MGECIHGFDDGLCAICFPPKVPEPAAPAPVARTRSSRPATRASGTAAATRSGRPGAARGTRLSDEPPVEVSKLRVYHLTHLDNLARILGAGAVRADQGDSPASPAVDVSASAARAYRRETSVDGATTLAEYVPFFLSTDAHLWLAIRDGRTDPRLSAPEAGGAWPASDFVLLVSSVGQALGARASLEGQAAAAESDASLPGAEVSVGWGEAERVLRRLAIAGDEALAAGEFLVKGEVPVERIQLIAVANDRVRDRVRDVLRAVGVKTRVAVYPPWFQPSAA